MSLIVCASRMSQNSTQSCIAQLHPQHSSICRPCCQMPSMPAPTLSAGHTHGHCHPTGRTFHNHIAQRFLHTIYYHDCRQGAAADDPRRAFRQRRRSRHDRHDRLISPALDMTSILPDIQVASTKTPVGINGDGLIPFKKAGSEAGH